MTEPHLAVSIQAAGFEDKPWDGHRGQALLAAPDRLLVIPPLPDVLSTDEPFEVLLIPLPLDAGGRIERLTPVRVDYLTVQLGLGAPTIAVVRLANDSRHRPNVREVPSGSIQDPAADLWAALQRAGAVASGQRDVLTPDLLRAAAKVEREQRSPQRGSMFADHTVRCDPFPRCILA